MTIELLAGQVLTVTADKHSAGTVRRLSQPGTTTQYDLDTVAASTSSVIGPFTGSRTYEILSTAGAVTYAVTQTNETLTLSDSARTLVVQTTSVAAGVMQTIPENSQAVVFGTLTVRGIITVLGTLLVPATPTA